MKLNDCFIGFQLSLNKSDWKLILRHIWYIILCFWFMLPDCYCNWYWMNNYLREGINLIRDRSSILDDSRVQITRYYCSVQINVCAQKAECVLLLSLNMHFLNIIFNYTVTWKHNSKFYCSRSIWKWSNFRFEKEISMIFISHQLPTIYICKK